MLCCQLNLFSLCYWMPRGDNIKDMKVSEGLKVETFLIYKLILSYVLRLRILRKCETAFAKKQTKETMLIPIRLKFISRSSLPWKKNTQEEQSKTKQKLLLCFYILYCLIFNYFVGKIVCVLASAHFWSWCFAGVNKFLFFYFRYTAKIFQVMSSLCLIRFLTIDSSM